MNICYLAKTFHQLKGGIETYTYRMAKELSKRGYQVHIITSSGDKKYHLDINKYKSVFIHEIQSNEPFRGSWQVNKVLPFLDILYSRKVAYKLYELIRNYKIDIIESPDWLYEGFWFSFKKAVPLVVKLHGHNSIFNYYVFKNLPNSLQYKMLWRFERHLLLNANAITSVSSYYASLISKCWDFDKSKIIVLYNGVDKNIFLPFSKRSIKEPYILFIGRIGKEKGVEVLVDTAPYVWKEYPHIKFVFIGGDEIVPKNKKSRRKYFLEKINDKRAVFLEALSYRDLITYYQNSLLCVFPSLFENLSTVTIEAMAYGKPVIATNVGGFQEIIEDGVNGLLVPPNNVKALTEAIKRLLKEQGLRDSLGQNAFKTVKEKFGIDKIADKTIKIYEETIKKFYND